MTHKTRGKFEPKWEGPFVVETIYLNGESHLINQDSDRMIISINGKFLKKNSTYSSTDLPEGYNSQRKRKLKFLTNPIILRIRI